MSFPFICSQFHLVEVLWQRVVAEPSLVERQVLGRSAGDVVDNSYTACWPHDRFTRDDIDHEEVQRGFRSMHVSPVTRAYHHANAVTLQLHKGQVRVSIPGARFDPFFVGFAPDLVAAAEWVALGRRERLVVPWESA